MNSASYVAKVRANVPADLHNLRAWLLWREVRNSGDNKAKKVPVYANGATRGKTDTPDDRVQLVTLDEAADAFGRGRATGLGIALGEVPGEGIHLSGIDLDACYTVTGLEPRAQQLLDAAGTYAEKSPSGTGLHIVGTGNAGTVKDDAEGLEIYSGGRYFTVTGERINQAGLGDITAPATLARILWRKQKPAKDGPPGGEKVRPSQRHNRCKEVGMQLRRAGLCGLALEHALLGWNAENCEPPLPADEVRALARWCSEQDVAADLMAQLRASIAADLAAGPDAIDNAEPPRWVVHKRLPVAGANLAAPGGTGKTTVILNEYVHIVGGGRLYGDDVIQQGPCVLVTAEDGVQHPRYILRRVIADGIDCAALPESAAARAKRDIKIVGWQRSAFGPIANVDRDGNVTRAAGFDVLLEQLTPLAPAVVTLDPSALFSPGERFGNDGEAFLAAMLHEAALALGCCFQVLDHVSQAVARGGIVDQHAARGGTAKTDNARMARQLVRFKPTESDTRGQPAAMTADDIEQGRILQLHWTKLNYGPLPTFAWLRRRGFWLEHVRSLSPDEIESERRAEVERRSQADAQAVVQAVREALLRGQKLSQSQLEDMGVLDATGAPIPRQRIRATAMRCLATGHLRYIDLPTGERRGARTQYLSAGGIL